MKIRILALLLCICLTCSLCACGSETNYAGKGDPSENGTFQNDENRITKLSRGCYNKYGYYECNGSLIYFFDVESKQKIVLCNNPNCKHNSDECNAYVNSKAKPANEIVFSADSNSESSFYSSTMFIFAEGDRLYILLTDGTMLSMKYDGTDRKTIAEIDSKYSFGEAYMLGREIIICAYYSVQEQGEIVEKACFITYNIDTHKWKQGEAFDGIEARTGRAKGITDDKKVIFYHQDEPPVITKGTPIEEAIKIQNSAKCQVFSVDVDNAEKTVLFDGTLGDCSDVTMLNGKIYFYSENKEQLCEMDSKTGEASVLLDNYPDRVMFGAPVGNCLEIGRTKDVIKQSTDSWNGENIVPEFFNVETKELTKAYTVQTNLNWYNVFPEILGETQDYYIMVYKQDCVEGQDLSGGPIVTDSTQYVGMILKKDFWNQNYNFEEVSWF